jgi:hypothetical protein
MIISLHRKDELGGLGAAVKRNLYRVKIAAYKAAHDDETENRPEPRPDHSA